MGRISLLLVAVALVAGAVGCAHCDTCDDFPTPCVGGDCGYAPSGPPGGYAMIPTMGVAPGMPERTPPGAYGVLLPVDRIRNAGGFVACGVTCATVIIATGADARSRTQHDTLALLGIEPARSHEHGQSAQSEELSRPVRSSRRAGSFWI